jgi:hypothetical protein
VREERRTGPDAKEWAQGKEQAGLGEKERGSRVGPRKLGFGLGLDFYPFLFLASTN